MHLLSNLHFFSFKLNILRILIAVFFVPNANLQAQERIDWIDKWIKENHDPLVERYVWFHSNPEVSHQEKETSAYLASAWKEAGFDVTSNVGGFGVVAVLKNGAGPTVMLRTDMDALPVTEETGLRFASTKKITTDSGVSTGVMHACGHDVHMTCMIGVAQLLSKHRDKWQGTLMIIGQPAEEKGAGALAMLKDGLFDRFPKPSAALALHCESSSAAGTIGIRAGYVLANVDSVDITVHGRGGHGAAPETTIDPIVQAAELVVSLQSIVSREIKPTDPAVVTVGSIHGGSKHNIIGDTCHLQLTVRSYSPKVRDRILDGIKRRANGIAQAYGAEPPTIGLSDGTPAVFNHEQLTTDSRKVLEKLLGKSNVTEPDPVMGGEDFSQYGLAGVPILMYRLGTIESSRLQSMLNRGQVPPSLHSSKFYPDIDETLPTAISTMTAAALSLLK